MEFVSKIPVEKGWSEDKKYCVTDSSGAKYLLRVSPAEKYAAKEREFAMMQRVEALGVPICRPLEFGQCDEGVYSIQSWIDGEDAEGRIPMLPEDAAYAYGLDAGRYLARIHTIPAPPEQGDWAVRFNRKMDYKIKKYGECPLKYEGGEAFLDYIAANRHLLANRPQSYQHGDYHIGNMMIDRAGKLIVIDFNRSDFGDPWEEFNRIVWCAQASPAMASGMVDGYFGERVPDEFWRLLALYISSNTLSSLYWAIPFGEGEIATMRRQAAEVLCWYDGMRNPVPTWYHRQKF
ncbi:MAG: phosphotransferase [Clostridia bacterium]|nr:phosphotransferase [Clostridia bacterium]